MGTQLIIDATHVERIVFSALTLLLVLHVLIYQAIGNVTYNDGGICETTCPTNSITNNIAYTCDTCNTNCAVCSLITTNCTACNANFFLNDNTCISSCPIGRFPDPTSTCTNCPGSCIACEALTYYTIC